MIYAANELTKNGLAGLIPENRDVYFLCVGTDRSTGDSYGPYVGTLLEKAGIPNVIGTLDDPTHAMNVTERVSKIPKGAFIVAIDACLGQKSSVGKIRLRAGSIEPGAGVGKDIAPIGDVAIYAVVNVGGFMEYFVLQNTRLSLVMNLAHETADCIVAIVKERQKQLARRLKNAEKRRERFSACLRAIQGLDS